LRNVGDWRGCPLLFRAAQCFHQRHQLADQLLDAFGRVPGGRFGNSVGSAQRFDSGFGSLND